MWGQAFWPAAALSGGVALDDQTPAAGYQPAHAVSTSIRKCSRDLKSSETTSASRSCSPDLRRCGDLPDISQAFHRLVSQRRFPHLLVGQAKLIVRIGLDGAQLGCP